MRAAASRVGFVPHIGEAGGSVLNDEIQSRPALEVRRVKFSRGGR